jgi:hypothetical protein
MRLNPALNSCGARPCTIETYSKRLALMLKSLQGYMEYLYDTPEADLLKTAFPIIAQIRQQGIRSVDPAKKAELIAQLQASIGNRHEAINLPDLVNRELLKPSTFGQNAGFQRQEIEQAAATFGSFHVDDNLLFFRPGLIDFEKLSEKLARVANFYAIRGPFSSGSHSQLLLGWGQYLNSCSEAAYGKVYGDLPASCKNQLNGLLHLFRAQYIPGEKSFQNSASNRLNEPVGGSLPALVSTSVLYNADSLYERGQKSYRATHPKPGTAVDFHPAFTQIRFGYWGSHRDLAKAETHLPILFPDDLKSSKFLDMNPGNDLAIGSWRTALRTSPAEPGLARMQKISTGQISAGGWSDLHPVQALRAMGCEKIVYITRRGGESKFAQKIAQELGMTEHEQQSLYGLDQASSSLNTALKEADAVWCTNWDDFKDAEVIPMANEAYFADLLINTSAELKDPFFSKSNALFELPAQGPYSPAQRQIKDNTGCQAHQ